MFLNKRNASFRLHTFLSSDPTAWCIWQSRTCSKLRWPVSANLPTQKLATQQFIVLPLAALSQHNELLCSGLVCRKIGTYGPPCKTTKRLL